MRKETHLPNNRNNHTLRFEWKCSALRLRTGFIVHRKFIKARTQM